MKDKQLDSLCKEALGTIDLINEQAGQYSGVCSDVQRRLRESCEILNSAEPTYTDLNEKIATVKSYQEKVLVLVKYCKQLAITCNKLQKVKLAEEVSDPDDDSWLERDEVL